jgi:hypothetical protein
MNVKSYEYSLTIAPGPYDSDPKATEEELSFLNKIAEDPSAAACDCKNKIKQSEKGFIARSRGHIQYGYSIAYYFKRNPGDYKLFLLQYLAEQPGDTKPYGLNTNPLRHVLNFVFNANTDEIKNRVGKYATALMPHFILGMPPHLVTKRIIEAGGIDAMYKQSVLAKQSASFNSASTASYDETRPSSMDENQHESANKESIELDFDIDNSSRVSPDINPPSGLVPVTIYMKPNHHELIKNMDEGVFKHIRVTSERIDETLILRGATRRKSALKGSIRDKEAVRAMLRKALDM